RSHSAATMSVSPPIRRLFPRVLAAEKTLSISTKRRKNASNVLSRKLEQLREEKIDLENALEAESEAHVNKLSREIAALRLAQQQGQPQTNGSGDQGWASIFRGQKPPGSKPEIMLDAMRRENEQLRNRLSDYIRITRLNEVYREELIEHRRRLGLPVDNLIGLSSLDPYSQPTHRRSSSTASSPSTSILALPNHSPVQHARASGVPIPRPPSQIHRPSNTISESTTPLSTHTPPRPRPPPPSPSPPSRYASATTTFTTPPSSSSFASNPPAFAGGPTRPLTYPSVPPPSLSSSFGSPTTSFLTHSPGYQRDIPSPVDSFASRRNSFHRRGSFDRRIAESGGLLSASRGQSHSRRASVERGARVAETGTLVPRDRAGSFGIPETAEAVESPAPAASKESGEAESSNEMLVRPS
ncbi:hypothetical protein A0H81_02551, partial [Grifola frondosa]